MVSNVNIYDLEKSILASGYAMRTETNSRDLTDKDYKRAHKLSKITRTTNNQAHDQFLSGILVSFDVTFTNKVWVEAERYRFLTFVTSQSTMHRITQFDLDKQYNEYVDPRIIEIMKEKVNQYNELVEALENLPNNDNMKYEKDRLEKLIKQKKLEILYSNPAGFKITARLTTNYRCLKNIYKQRHDHQLPEWREFCSWIETLPYAKELIILD